ncbi:MAG: hypothetical protein AAB443_03490 [Patescibacteria group bacterium]
MLLIISMLTLVDRSSKLWNFLGENLQGLVADGEVLISDVALHEKNITDYSYLVFPFAKAYEGFLKKLFLELKLIDKSEFYGDEVRIGRILNPTFRTESKSVYDKIPHLPDRNLSEYLWSVWKSARNLVFHYYPNNFRKLTFEEAKFLIDDVVEAMLEAVVLV